MYELDENEDPDVPLIRAFLEVGVDPNATDHVGWTALMLGVDGGINKNPEVIKALLDGGADPNLQIDERGGKDQLGRTALMIAAKWNTQEVVKALIDGGADLEIRDNDGMTALMFAAAYGSAEVVKTLLDAGASVKTKDNEGREALDFARRNNRMRKSEVIGRLRA